MLSSLKADWKIWKWGSDEVEWTTIALHLGFSNTFKPLESLLAFRCISKSFKDSFFIQMLCIGNGCEPKPYSGCSCSSLWLCITTSTLQLRSLPVTYRIANSCNTLCKEPIWVLKLYLWPLRATTGKEGMLTFSCSLQTAAWRLDCRERWCVQWLPVETAVLLVMSWKIWLLFCPSSV